LIDFPSCTGSKSAETSPTERPRTRQSLNTRKNLRVPRVRHDAQPDQPRKTQDQPRRTPCPRNIFTMTMTNKLKTRLQRRVISVFHAVPGQCPGRALILLWRSSATQAALPLGR